MRDVIWTLIIVWLVYRIVSAFKSKPSSSAYNNSTAAEPAENTKQKEAAKRSLEKEGDYIDYEEIK